MGNWRNRPRFYRQRYPRSPPRSYHERDSLPYVFSDDGVPAWEKKFCSLIGSMPWRKVVEAKNFMSCHGNVIHWDDSAGEEAFHNSKKRFWSEMNGLPCDISLPDPNMYIDEINWDTMIDPELIKDLEREYFAPLDEGQIEFKLGRKNKRTRNSRTLPVEECDQRKDTAKNPWECNNGAQGSDLLRNKSQGWSQWESSINSSFKDSNNGNNPWEQNLTRGNETGNNATWGDCSGMGWENHGDNSWGSNWQDSGNPWRHSYQDNGTSRVEGWGDGRANVGGWETQKITEHRRWEFKRSSDGWRDLNGGSLKRESTHGYISGYRNSRFKRDDNRTGNDWRTAKPNRRVTFVAK